MNYTELAHAYLAMPIRGYGSLSAFLAHRTGINSYHPSYQSIYKKLRRKVDEIESRERVRQREAQIRAERGIASSLRSEEQAA